MPVPKPLRTWAGHGSGATCDGCGRLIEPHQIEYEIEMPQGSEALSLYFHFDCYRDWTARGIR
jgi:methionyl-tRNA synthetase